MEWKTADWDILNCTSLTWIIRLQEAKMEEESLARARAAKLSEVTWGQMEDAEEEEEQVRPPQP
jgi:hypothetical protein